MTTPKYTFLLPAFKGKYLDEMLKSIKAQTYTDFKVLISDDCSPEDLRSICEPFLSDPRFSYRRNEENMGSKSLVSHWNLLVDMCDTEYLIMASDDDVYEPQFLAEIDALVQKYPNVDLFRARVRKIDIHENTIAEDPVSAEHECQVDFIYGQYCLRRLDCIGNYVFRLQTLEMKNGFVDFPLAWGSDEATVMQMSSNGVCITPSILFNFRISGANISSSSNNRKTMTMMDQICYFEKFFNNIKTDGSTLQRNRLNSSKEEFKTQRIRMIKMGMEYLPYSDFFRLYSFFKQEGVFTGFLDKLHFIWTWIRAWGSRV